MKFCVFGSTELAEECLRALVTVYPDCSVTVVRKAQYNASLDDYCQQRKIPTLDSASELEGSFDYGFSIRFHQIIQAKVIRLFRQGIINFHGGPLPEYRGSANHIFALLNGEAEFGVTAHWLTEGIDEGPVLFQERFPVDKDETGWSLLQKSKSHGFVLFIRVVEHLKHDVLPAGEPQDLNVGTTYKTKDLDPYRVVDTASISSEELDRRLRAFYHPNRRSLQARLGNNKVEIRLEAE